MSNIPHMIPKLLRIKSVTFDKITTLYCQYDSLYDFQPNIIAYQLAATRQVPVRIGRGQICLHQRLCSRPSTNSTSNPFEIIQFAKKQHIKGEKVSINLQTSTTHLL